MTEAKLQLCMHFAIYIFIRVAFFGDNMFISASGCPARYQAKPGVEMRGGWEKFSMAENYF
jgi:hypothetical protein